MDSHPKKEKKRKKKNQYRANQKSIHGHVVGRENQIQSIQSKSKPNPITQYYNTGLFINQKKKNPIQRKPNPRPRANQTHGETPTVTLLAGAARSVAHRPCLLLVDSSLVRPSQPVATLAIFFRMFLKKHKLHNLIICYIIVSLIIKLLIVV